MKEDRDIRDLFELLSKRVSLLLRAKVFVQKSGKESIKEAIFDSFSILKWLAKDNKKFLGEVDKLFEEFKGKYEFDKEIVNVDYSDKSLEELKDEVNYLKISAKNIFNVDIDVVTLEELNEKEAASDKYKSNTDASAVYTNFFDTPAVNPDDVSKVLDDLVIKSHAYDRLKQDINNGNIYVYKTKPKRNVIIKNFLSCLLFVGIIISVILWVLSIYPNSSPNNKLLVISLCSSIYFVYGFFKLRKTYTNDNFKYSFQHKTFWHMVSFSILFSIIFSTDGDVMTAIFQNTQNGISSVLWASLVSIVVLEFLVYLIAYICLQPEKDQKLIENVIAKHISDISNSASLNS